MRVAETIATNLRSAREQADLSQGELASRLGLASHSAVCDMEAGRRRVSATELARLSEILSRPVDWFFAPQADHEDFIALARAQGRPQAVRAALAEAEKYFANFLFLERVLGKRRRGGPAMASEGIQRAVKAAQILRRRWRAGPRPAHHLFDLAEQNRVLVFRLALDPGLSGAFVRSRRHRISVIVVNTSRKSPHHQRFTLAHELGHLELHEEEGLVESIDSGSQDPREREANVFAAELLVPLSEVKRTLRKTYRPEPGCVRDELVVHLARLFGVSHEVILWRLKIVLELPEDEVTQRVRETNWSSVWQQYAPDACASASRGGEARTWGGEGVSEETARQVSRLPAVYREMAFEAYRRREITAGKLAEVLGLPDQHVALEEVVPLIDPGQRPRLAGTSGVP